MEELTTGPPATIFISSGLSVTLLVWGFYSINAEVKRAGSGALTAESPDSVAIMAIMPYVRVFGQIIVWFFFLFKPKNEEKPGLGIYIWTLYERLNDKIANDLLHAGMSDTFAPREVWGLTIVSFIGGCLFGGLFYANYPNTFVLIGPGLGSIALPFLWLTEQATRRQKAIGRSLPFAIDLLALMMRTGLDFTVGMERMVRELPDGPLTEEFRQVCQKLRVGDSREEALRKLAHRTGVPSVGIFTSAVIHSDRMGGEITSVLDTQAKSLRVKRFQTAEAEAQKAPVKMLFPLLLFIFPCVFIVLFGPLLIKHKLDT